MFVVFDLDGTLADDTHRAHFLDQEPKDWDAYFAACGGDTLIEPIAEIFRALFASDLNRVEIWTGRSESVREETFHWVHRHLFEGSYGEYVRIRMRPSGDFRPDTEVKGEWLDQCGDNPPDIIIDDRTKSVAFWRERGITCLQVAQHDY